MIATPDKWTLDLIMLMARGMVPPPVVHACKTCKVIYNTVALARGCERGHVLYPTAPSQFHPANREPLNTAPKSEVYCSTEGIKFCGGCATKMKDTEAGLLLKTWILNPGPCNRCGNPILPPVLKIIEKPSFLKPSERHEILRLSRSRRGQAEQLRRQWHKQLARADAKTSGSEIVDTKTQNENGIYHNDTHRGNVRTNAGGYIEVDPETEEIEFNP